MTETNPQIENGHTRIANEILEVVARTKLSPTQYRIILIVWRYTYGFQRKAHKLSLTFLSKATGGDRRNIQRELNNLIERNILTVKNSGQKRLIGFNKHYKRWLTGGEIDNGETDNGEINASTGGEQDAGTVGEINAEERKKEKSKENIYNIVFSHWNSKKIIVHKELKDEHKKEIDKAIKVCSVNEILLSIDRYEIMLSDEKYEFCSYKWSLKEFLSRDKGYKLFLDDGSKWINYKQQQGKRVPKDDKPEFNKDKRDLSYLVE